MSYSAIGLFRYYPALDGSLVLLKIHADFDNLLVSGFILNRIAFIINLFECFFGSAVKFEFK